LRNITPLKAFRHSRGCGFYFVLVTIFSSANVWAQPEILSSKKSLPEENLLEEDLFEEGLLAGEEYEFEPHSSQVVNSWHKGIRITLQQTYVQGKQLEISRSEARIEYEVAPWEGAYIRIDDKYTYYGHDDQQLGVGGDSFGHNKLQEAWLQLSESSCVAKLGRQGLSWGAIEGAFAVDVVSPFDFTEPLLTDYSNIRLSQDMLLADCYFENTQIQSFYVTSARINNYQQKNTSLLAKLEESLHDEWGVRLTKSWKGLDVSLMYAHLYGNKPLTVFDSKQSNGLRLDVARYDFVGLSTVWAIGRLLLEFDFGYKKNELENFSGKEGAHVETAFGFEYTTSNNHQLNAGVWVFDEVLQEPAPLKDIKRGSMQSWTLGWAKTYMNDDLVMSFLGSWLTESEVLSTALLAQYQWDDYWNFSTALTYSDSGQSLEASSTNGSDLALLLKAKLEF